MLAEKREAGQREAEERAARGSESSSPRDIEVKVEPAGEVVNITLETKLAKELLLALTRAVGRAAYND